MEIRSSKHYFPAAGSDVSVSAIRAQSTGLARVPVVSEVIPTNFTQTFYVSPTGNDSAAGTSPATAWRTISRAMSQSYTAGMGLLFQRGGSYSGQINKTATPSGGLRWTIGAYGTGALPIIDSYKVLNNSGAWVNTATNQWRIDITNGSTHSGNTGNTTYNTGHLKVGSTAFGDLKASLGAMTKQWDFYPFTSPYLYVWSAGNPTTVAGAGGLRAAPNTNVIHATSNLEVRGLELTGAGANGIAHAGNQANNLVVADNIIHHCGGSVLYNQGNARYGNGVEVWVPGSNWVIENNEIYEVYDVAASVQGNTQAGTLSNNVIFRNNNFHNNSQTFEVWAGGGARLTNIFFDNNVCSDAGFCWSGPVRPNQDLRCHLLASPTWEGTGHSVTIQNNDFIRASNMYWFTYPTFMAGIVSQNNNIQLTSGTKMCLITGETINQAAQWRTNTGKESGSTFTVL